MRKLSLLLLMVFTLNSLFAAEQSEKTQKGEALEQEEKVISEELKDEDPALLEEDEELDAGEKIGQWKEKIPFDISLSLDAYVQTNFAGKETNAIVNESFSDVANSFELGMINLIMSKDFGKVGFTADLGFGPRANAANGINLGSIAAIKQLFVTYTPVDFLNITFGNFSTFYGWELIEPQNNFHYSTSLAFQNGPFYHTGIKFDFSKNNWNFMVGAFNDTDAKTDGDRNKFVGAQLGYSGDRVSTYFNYLGGDEGPSEGMAVFSKSYKSSFGITSEAILGANEGGSLVVDLAYHRFRLKEDMTGDIFNTDYFIAYLYGQASISENGAIGARVGYASDKDGFIGGADHYTDFTLTYNHTIAGLLTIVPEFKLDYATEKVFPKNDGTGSNTQFRLMLAAIFAI